MGYENDPYRDEDGEALMNYDDFNSDPEPKDPNQNNLLDDNFDDGNDGGWDREPSLETPVHDDFKAKPRKRLVKKSGTNEPASDFRLRDEDGDDYGDGMYDDVAEFVGDELEDDGLPSYSSGGGNGIKRKKFVKESSGGERRKEKKRGEGKGEKKFKARKVGGGKLRDREGDREMKEMWETVAGGDSEDDRNGLRTLDDDNFIDDSGVDPADQYGSDRERSPGAAPQAEEGEEEDEIKELFRMGKKKKKSEKSSGEISYLVVSVMAELDAVAEQDAELNILNRPAINKLKKLPYLTEVLSKKQLQQEFLDHDILGLLRKWLEPLPDGSLPNINVRAAILKILTDFPIDLEQFDRREQLKKSGLGKVIMFLSKSDEETTANRRLAKDLVDQWSRPIFNKSTRFEDMRNYEAEKAASRRSYVKKPMSKHEGMESRDDDLDLAGYSQGSKSGQLSIRQHASRPEALSMDFQVRPQSKIDPEEVRARAKQVMQDQRRQKMNKKLQQLKAPKRKQLQATKLSVEGRGMVKYL